MIFLRCSGAAVASSCAQSNSLASTAGSHQHCHHYYFEKQTFVIIFFINLLTKLIELSQVESSYMSEHRKFQIYFFCRWFDHIKSRHPSMKCILMLPMQFTWRVIVNLHSFEVSEISQNPWTSNPAQLNKVVTENSIFILHKQIFTISSSGK